MQHPITFLTEENLDKLETHCRKAIHFERGMEHQITLELIERYKEYLVKEQAYKKRIQELEEENKILLNSKVGIDLSYDDYISKQKIKDKIEDLRYNNKLGFEESLEEFFKIEVLEELLEEE